MANKYIKIRTGIKILPTFLSAFINWDIDSFKKSTNLNRKSSFSALIALKYLKASSSSSTRNEVMPAEIVMKSKINHPIYSFLQLIKFDRKSIVKIPKHTFYKIYPKFIAFVFPSKPCAKHAESKNISTIIEIYFDKTLLANRWIKLKKKVLTPGSF